jgi:hypothetical protein
LLRKKKEKAQKIYDELGVDRIKRIQTFTAASITKLSQDDIDYVLANFRRREGEIGINDPEDIISKYVNYHN